MNQKRLHWAQKKHSSLLPDDKHDRSTHREKENYYLKYCRCKGFKFVCQFQYEMCYVLPTNTYKQNHAPTSSEKWVSMYLVSFVLLPKREKAISFASLPYHLMHLAAVAVAKRW